MEREEKRKKEGKGKEVLDFNLITFEKRISRVLSSDHCTTLEDPHNIWKESEKHEERQQSKKEQQRQDKKIIVAASNKEMNRPPNGNKAYEDAIDGADRSPLNRVDDMKGIQTSFRMKTMLSVVMTISRMPIGIQ
ncbi:hypothetical protein V3C99_003844 [Haemonchus contortus]